MNETNKEQNQKPRTSKLAIASIICLGLSFVFCFSMGNALVFFVVPTVGVAALIHIGLSKGRLRGKGLAFSAIVIPICLLILVPSMNHLKRYIQRTLCASNLSGISAALKVYANDYGDQLPTPESWCDLLVIQDDINENRLSGHRETSDTGFGESAYALNKNIFGIKLSKIPSDVVLLFETTYGRTDSERDTPWETRDYFWKIYDPNEGVGPYRADDLLYKDRWNQVGGKEILTTEYHADNGCHILFADGSVKFVKKKNLDTLRWEP